MPQSMQCLELVPALITPTHVAPHDTTAKQLMVTVTVVQTAMPWATVVWMLTALHVTIIIFTVPLNFDYEALFLLIFLIVYTEPRTCADVGITTCCNDPVNGRCDVFHRSLHNNRYRCSCNATCHDRNDCCSDAVAIGCVRKFSMLRDTI